MDYRRRVGRSVPGVIMRTSALFAFLLLLVLSACSKSVRVPPADYENPGSAAAYRIVTVDQGTFSVKKYTVSDSVIVVTELAPSATSDEDSLQAPFAIPLQSVQSIDRVTLDRGRSSGWVFGVGVGFLLIALAAAASISLGG